MRAGGVRVDGSIECLVESDGAAAENKEQRSALRRWNKYQYGYGGGKLGCDEELAQWFSKTSHGW